MSLLSSEPIDVARLIVDVSDPEHGGIAVFLGTIRRDSHLRPVAAIEYDADRPLAEREIAAILTEGERRFGARLVARHRLGHVAVGQAGVAVVAAAAHRAEAFDACRFAIDEIKLRAPIWKRIAYEDGGSEWLDQGSGGG